MLYWSFVSAWIERLCGGGIVGDSSDRRNQIWTDMNHHTRTHCKGLLEIAMPLRLKQPSLAKQTKKEIKRVGGGGVS